MCNLIETRYLISACHFILFAYAKLISAKQILIRGKQDNQAKVWKHLGKGGSRETAAMQKSVH